MEAVGDTAEGVGSGGRLLGRAAASRDLATKENVLNSEEGEEEQHRAVAGSPATVTKALYRQQELRSLHVQLLHQLALRKGSFCSICCFVR